MEGPRPWRTRQRASDERRAGRQHQPANFPLPPQGLLLADLGNQGALQANLVKLTADEEYPVANRLALKQQRRDIEEDSRILRSCQ